MRLIGRTSRSSKNLRRSSRKKKKKFKWSKQSLRKTKMAKTLMDKMNAKTIRGMRGKRLSEGSLRHQCRVWYCRESSSPLSCIQQSLRNYSKSVNSSRWLTWRFYTRDEEVSTMEFVCTGIVISIHWRALMWWSQSRRIFLHDFNQLITSYFRK